MQASWIDFDELRALAAGLQDPVEESHDEAWAPEPLLDDAFFAEDAPALSSSTPEVPAATAPISDPVIELQTLHEQLRVIREKALAAGLLPVVTERPMSMAEEPPSAQESMTHEEAPTVEEPVMVPQPPVAVPAANTESSFIPKPELTEMSRRLQDFQQFAVELTSCQDLLLMNQEGDLLWGDSQQHDIMATIMIAMRYHSKTAFEATHFKLTNLDDALVVLSTITRHGQVFLALINATHTDEINLEKLNSAMVAAMEGW